MHLHHLVEKEEHRVQASTTWMSLQKRWTRVLRTIRDRSIRENLRNLIHLRMKKINVLLISLLCFSCKADGVDTPAQQYDSIEELVAGTVENKEIPGLIAAIVDENGLKSVAAAGLRNVDLGTSIIVEDKFHLGSCTKAMTSTLIAVLVKEGKLNWDTKLIDVFPEYKTLIDTKFHSVTLSQLVRHRSGMPANVKWREFPELSLTKRRLALMKKYLAEPGAFKVGDFNYSNLGYMVAGSMAEKVTGKSWETLMLEKLFTPLDMQTAGFGPPATNQANQPWGHVKQGSDWEPINLDNDESIGPAGTVHASFRDWAKFISLQLSKSQSNFLNRQELDELIDPTGDYAAGWFVVNRSWANGIALSHSGSNTFWYALVWVAPNLNRAFIVVTNSYDESIPTVCNDVVANLINLDTLDN